MNIERIMREHESDESLEASDERLIENAMREQFENADEVMAAMREHGLTGKAFFEHGLGDDAFSPARSPRKEMRQSGHTQAHEVSATLYAHTYVLRTDIRRSRQERSIYVRRLAYHSDRRHGHAVMSRIGARARQER